MRKLGQALVAALLIVSAVHVDASVLSRTNGVGAPGQTSLTGICYYYHLGYWIAYPC